MIGESVDWLYDDATEMDAEDGVIWVYGLGHEQLMAFTNFGIETLVELIKIHKDDSTLLRIEKAKPFIPAACAGWLPITRSTRGRWSRAFPDPRSGAYCEPRSEWGTPLGGGFRRSIGPLRGGDRQPCVDRVDDRMADDAVRRGRETGQGLSGWL